MQLYHIKSKDMRGSNTGYQIITNSACILFMVLFVYAATSKILDFNHFKIQLSRSPYIFSYSNVIAWAIPITELLIAGLFLFPKYRLLAFYASFSLMTIFTTYLLIVLNISDSIPCSCGGILTKLGWNEHVVFNTVFIIIALLGILLQKKQKNYHNNTK